MSYSGQPTGATDSPAFTNLTVANQGLLSLRELNPPNGIQAIRLQAPASLPADVSLILPATIGAAGNVLLTDGAGNLSWGPPHLANQKVTAQTTTTLASNASPAFMTGMTLTPGAGTYRVIFNCECQMSNSGRLITLMIYANGALVADSARRHYFATAAQPRSCKASTIVTVAAGQTIEGWWSVSANTGTNNDRSLILIKLND